MEGRLASIERLLRKVEGKAEKEGQRMRLSDTINSVNVSLSTP